VAGLPEGSFRPDADGPLSTKKPGIEAQLLNATKKWP
jgi:hypothetical protein